METTTKATIKDKLIEPYEIDVEENQYVLVKPSVTQSGKGSGQILRTGVGYYTTLGAALLAVAKRKMSDVQRVYSIREYMNEHTAMLSEFVQKIHI